jgi:hypothetical protein
MDMVREKGWQMAVVVLALALLAPALACSQQTDPPATQDPGSGSSAAQTPTTSTDSGAAPVPAATTQGLFARALNSASPLPGDNGPLQWGWFSVRSVSYLQYFNEVNVDTPGLPPSSQDETVAQLSTSLVVNHAFGASHQTQLTVQYAPSLFITEGHVYADAFNQSAGIDTTFHLSPRLTMQISDRFSYFANQRYYSGLSLGVNYSQGTVAQNSFLNGPGSVLYNTVSATFSYLWSPLTSVSITPSFGYQKSTGAENSGENLSSLTGGGMLSVTHSLSPTQTIGMSYSGQYATYTNTSTIAGPQSNSFLQDFLVNYGKQLAASWRLGLGLGVTSSTNTGGQTGVAATAGISKSFHLMDFAVNYDRGHQFNGYITSASTDRVDLVNVIRWSPRFTTNSSVAYFRTDGGAPAGPSGFYATEQLAFGLTRTLSLIGGVAYTKQIGDEVYIETGNTRMATVGLTWTPASAVR